MIPSKLHTLIFRMVLAMPAWSHISAGYIVTADLGNLPTGMFIKLLGIFQRLLLAVIRHEFYFQGLVPATRISQWMVKEKLMATQSKRSDVSKLNKERRHCISPKNYFFTQKEPAIPPRTRLRAILAEL